MPKRITNQEIAEVFREIADILDLKNDNVFKIRAYRRAAQVIEGLEKPLSEVSDLESLPGIGKELSEKIQTLLRGEKLEVLERLRKEVEPGLLQLLRIRGMGPKRVRTLNEKLGVKDIEGFRSVLEGEEILKLPGFGKKLVLDLKKGLSEFQEYAKRVRLDIAKKEADELVNYLKEAEGVKAVVIAGSVRRRLETIGDIDILVTGRNADAVMDRFVDYSGIREVLSKGEAKSSVVLKSGIQADVRFFKPEEFGAGLLYFTGSKSHNIALRTYAKHKGLKISEYGVFRGDKKIAGRTEEEVYRVFGMSLIPPELREDRGELEAAREGRLPVLIEEEDIKGDLHVHSEWSDGRNPIKEIADYAKGLGYEYIAITDHSKSQRQAHGLNEKELLREFEEIEEINKGMKDFVILKGVEVDILKDGALDISGKVLKKADVVLGAIHGNFNLTKEEQTKRLIKAVKTGLLHILAHPSTRLIGEREPIEINWEELSRVLYKMRVAVEINASPYRLDVNGEQAKYLKEQGLLFVINTDAHFLGALREMEYGVYTARRGWLSAKDVINTLDIERLLKWLKFESGT